MRFRRRKPEAADRDLVAPLVLTIFFFTGVRGWGGDEKNNVSALSPQGKSHSTIFLFPKFRDSLAKVDWLQGHAEAVCPGIAKTPRELYVSEDTRSTTSLESHLVSLVQL